MSKNKNDSSYQVIVVGAGPAGLSLAINLGRNNISTLLIDKKKKQQIGDKICGDALSPNSSRILYSLCQIPEPEGDAVEENLNKAIFGSEGKFEISIPFTSRTIDRLKYGQQLLKYLSNYKSVNLLTETKVTKAILDKGKVVGCEIVNKKGKKEEIMADIVADCSGATAIIRRTLEGKEFDKIMKKLAREETIVACREIIETSKPHAFQKEMRIESHPELPHPGYFWIFSKGEKKVNIGAGWLLNDKNKKYKPCEVLKQIRDKIFTDFKVIASGADQLPGRLPLHSLVGNGFIACGDAATLVNPISGEGHGPALISGYYASEVIKEAINKNDFTESTLWKYNKIIWEKYGYLGGLGIAVHKLLNAFPFSDFEFLFVNGVITQKDVDEIMDSTSYHPPILNKILKGIKKPKLLFKLTEALAMSKRIQKLSLEYPSSPDRFYQWERKIVRIEKRKL